MQLKPRRLGRVSGALGLLTANLFAAGAAHAQDTAAQDAAAQAYAPVQAPSFDAPTGGDDNASDAGMTRIDSAVLFYQEAGGRVKATEPVVSVNLNSSSGDVLSLKFTSDTLTGATPNGATPWKQAQTFITPAQAPGTTTTVTGASGGSTIVTIPGTGTVARQYVIAPHALPVDAGFRDQRYAGDIGYSTLWDPDTRLSVGGSFSSERDYSSFSINGGVSRDFNHHNTTASLGLNFEFDKSSPTFGTPQPLTVMSADPKGPDQSKTVSNLVLGVTLVMSRRWLAQLNYSVGLSDGYQTDPYRFISVVDPVTGAPVEYLYESRPKSRVRQSVYFGNKVAIGPTVVDFSARAYHDSWGINSVTADLAYRVPIISWIYVEPEARYYHQSAASFFRDYLVSGQPLPSQASSDSRLDKFNAVTLGLKVGFKLFRTGELYVQGENYKQTGTNHPAGAIGDLANEKLFTGVNATSVMVGYSFAFY